jgi:hypothetical protein
METGTSRSNREVPGIIPRIDSNYEKQVGVLPKFWFNFHHRRVDRKTCLSRYSTGQARCLSYEFIFSYVKSISGRPFFGSGR